MHILIAMNAFKNSLDAERAALAVQKGFVQSNVLHSSEIFPIGDGGDGTAALLIKKCNASGSKIAVMDALGRTIHASIGWVEAEATAIIEMADASGIRLLKPDELNPMSASSFGTGEMIIHALDKGAKRIVLCMGGSATVDGGMGILRAMGIRFLTGEKEVISTPAALMELDTIDQSALDTRILACELTILCDVDNLLLGENGAAAVFGPQKGASHQEVIHLDAALTRLSGLALELTGKDMTAVKYGGAAGGAAAGLHVFLNAKLVNGIDHFLHMTDFAAALDKADLVVTGEGSIDEQTLQGKGPFGVALASKKRGLPVIAYAGSVPLQRNLKLQRYFDVLLSIGHQPQDLASAISCTEANLIRTAEETAQILALFHTTR